MLQRLILLFIVILLPACALESEDEREEEEVEQSEEAITAGPQWKMLTLVVRNIDTSYTSDGQSAAQAMPAKFERWNGGRAPASRSIA